MSKFSFIDKYFSFTRKEEDSASPSTHFPLLDREPRNGRPMLLSANHLTVSATKSSYLPGAPPPYKSATSLHEDDRSSGLWSDSSYSQGSAKRRSWDNLVNAEENLRSLKANAYPKVSSSTCSAQSLPQKLSPSNGYSQRSTQFDSKLPTARYPTSTSNSVFSEITKPMAYRPNYMMAPMPAASSSEIPAGMPGSRAPTAATITSLDPPRKKRDRMDEIRKFCSKPSTKLCCFIFVIILIGLIVAAVVLSQIFALPRHLQFSWMAPDSQRQGNQNPNQLQMDVAGEQVRMELHGTMPFKSNYVSVLDFRSNRVAIVDSALKVGGRNMICFIMDLDRSGIRSIEDFQRAAGNSEKKRVLNSGWDESWNYIPQVMDSNQASQLFKPDVAECRGARWVQLNLINTYQKNNKCTECFDFCLPEYGIQNDNIRGESYLNIVRRNCFYMYVPEWRGYAYQSPNQPPQLPPNFPAGQAPADQSGIIGTINQIGQNPTVQRIGDEIESKWINVKTLPQQIYNNTQDAFQSARGQLNQWGQQVFGQANNNQNRPMTPTEFFNQPTVVPPVQQPHQINPFSQPNSNQNQQNQPFPYSSNNNQNNQPIQPRGEFLGSMHNVNQPPLSSVQFGSGPSGQPQWPSQGLGNLGWNNNGQIVVGQSQNPQPQRFEPDEIRQQQASPQFNPNSNQQQNQGWVNVGGK